jgi:uncharacterized membrane protein YfcA
MRNFLFGFCLFLAASTSTVVWAQDDEAEDSFGSDGGGKCSVSQKYKCPNSEDCPDSGFSFVKDCLDCEGNLNTNNPKKECFDRKIFNTKDNPSSNYLWYDIAGMIVWFFAAGVATACGVGGGGIYVPLGIILINFAPKPASGLSQCSIFGASLGGLLLNLRNTHPFTAKIEKSSDVAEGDGTPEGETAEANIPTIEEEGEQANTDATKYYTRPLIDYDMALFLAPMEMAGAVLGVVIQTILPNWLYLLTAAVILGFTARKTYLKWGSTRAKELEKAAALEAEQAAPASSTPAADGENPTTGDKEDIEVKADGSDADANPPDVVEADATTGEEARGSEAESEEVLMDADKMARRLFFLERDARQYPVEKLVCFAILWIGLTLLTFFKGGKGVPSLVGINCTSPWYYVMIAFQFLWTFGFALFFAIKLMRETTEKKSVGYPFHSQDVLWDFSKTKFYAFFTFVAGIVAGLIGIGGGMVLGPLMLVMGIYPRVSTATTATMIVLTSSGVAISYVTSGLVPWQYAVTFFCTCFTGALVGKTKIDGYVKKTGKSSILIFMLATIIALATFGALLIALLRLSGANWCFPGFKPFCYVDDGSVDVECIPGEEERRLGSDFYGDVVRGGL